jgi:hypothetical protein
MEETYAEYHQRVVSVIRARALARWPPRTDAERAQIEANVKFFDTQCDYHEEFAEGLDPAEFADHQIDAAS